MYFSNSFSLKINTTETELLVVSTTVLPAKSQGDVMFCLQSNQGLRIDRSLVY